MPRAAPPLSSAPALAPTAKYVCVCERERECVCGRESESESEREREGSGGMGSGGMGSGGLGLGMTKSIVSFISVSKRVFVPSSMSAKVRSIRMCFLNGSNDSSSSGRMVITFGSAAGDASACASKTVTRKTVNTR